MILRPIKKFIVFKSKYLEIKNTYFNFERTYTDGSNDGKRAAAAAVPDGDVIHFGYEIILLFSPPN